MASPFDAWMNDPRMDPRSKFHYTYQEDPVFEKKRLKEAQERLDKSIVDGIKNSFRRTEESLQTINEALRANGNTVLQQYEIEHLKKVADALHEARWRLKWVSDRFGIKKCGGEDGTVPH